MHRSEILSWLHHHPESVHGDVDRIVERCEREARQHAREDAWLAAKRYAEDRARRWKDGWGFHASDAYVAREACLEMARALRAHEPHFEHGDEPHLAGQENLAAFEPQGLMHVEPWILELAEQEKHRAWREIVRFTKHEAKVLGSSGAYSDDLHDWDANANYMVRAADVARLLADEFGAHARSA